MAEDRSDELMNQQKSSDDPRQQLKQFQSPKRKDVPPRGQKRKEHTSQNMKGSTIPKDMRKKIRGDSDEDNQDRKMSDKEPSRDDNQSKPSPPDDVQFHSENLKETNPAKKIRETEKKIEKQKESPEMQYKQKLENNDIPLEEAEHIIDTVLLREKPYTEQFQLYKGLTATFRTRNEMNMEQMYAKLESRQPRFPDTKSMVLAKWNLATSLAEYRGRTFPPDEDGVIDAAEQIEELNYQVFDLLTRKLQEFNDKINTVFSEGYLDAF